jgi:streptogramin lyase
LLWAAPLITRHIEGLIDAKIAADALLSFDPAREKFTVYPLPSTGALVRHIDVDPRTGDVWAAYGASPGIEPRIARLRIPAGGQ